MVRVLLPRVALSTMALVSSVAGLDFNAKSGIRPWVDVSTPKDAYTVTSSRGATWDLVFSDEFNVAGRDFSAGKDYLWTALELPDGVNAALEYYSINMTSTVTEPDGRGVFQIKVMEDEIKFTVYNAYTRPPEFQDHVMYYRGGMVQSWNKFCFQGGYVEVSANLPGAISAASGNPDLGNDRARVESLEYYPTWPGVWFLGNLGRALFTASTNRMWPWSFDKCDKSLEKDQRISGCDSDPGYGLNPNQGRGAPEIDLLEGGGTDVSSSIQVAPGMPDQFRLIPVTDADSENIFCFYAGACATIGANFPGIPTATYEARGHKSWYQGLRYAPNTLCAAVGSKRQTASTVLANAKAGWKDNKCSTVNACPGSNDGYADLSPLDNSTTEYWGVNAAGGCMPKINGYQGSYLCDPDNSNNKCVDPLRDGNTKTNILKPFNYQMDAISANWGLPLSAYTQYIKYQVEWVMGRQGYVRWLVEGIPIFEIPSDAVENPPQDAATSNPQKVMVEEPLYVIFNVALSTSWGARPPNPGRPCRGDGKDPKINKICDDFPMYLKIDYIRIYQDLSPASTMAIGCDPATHPTKEWIDGHIEEYEDTKNKWIPVQGGAPCTSDDDCTVATVAVAAIVTGRCKTNKCECTQNTWGGPRCTQALSDGGRGSTKGYGPSVALACAAGGVGLVLLLLVVFKIVQHRNRRLLEQAFPYPKSTRQPADDQEQAMEDLAQSRSTSVREDPKPTAV